MLSFAVRRASTVFANIRTHMRLTILFFCFSCQAQLLEMILPCVLTASMSNHYTVSACSQFFLFRVQGIYGIQSICIHTTTLQTSFHRWLRIHFVSQSTCGGSGFLRWCPIMSSGSLTNTRRSRMLQMKCCTQTMMLHKNRV